MYQVSNSFLQAMDDISRTLTVEVEISGVSYPTDAIIRFDLERGAFDNDVFTIGQTTANALTLEIFTTPTIQTGDEIKLYTSLRVGEKDERVPLGVYYVDSTRVNKEKMTLTCYDKMVTLIDEYIPSANHTTLAALFEDVLSQIGMTYDGVFHDAPIKAPLYGYTYRETLGFIASLNGGNMSINRAGHLEIQRFQTVERAIPAKACFSFEVKEAYRVSKVFCQFGDVGITRGDSGGQCVAFENPYVTEQNIDVIYNQLNGLSFTAATLNYRGDLTLDPGDIFQFTDYKGDIYPLMCGRNKLTFNGGLSGQLDSIGESENTNSYAESQLKYKKNITKVTAELGKIQAIVQEIEQSHDGLEERVEKAELEITADAIKSKVEDVFVAKDEISGLVTEEQLQSAITQSAESITTQVSNTYETKEEVTHKLNDAQSIAKAMQDGKILYPDATFKESYNGFSIYNNAFNDSVTIERIPKPYDCPTTSTHCIKIKHTGQGAPGHGGFCQLIYSRPNAVFIQKIIAKLPPGRRLMVANNPLGDGATDRWLTSSVGTGNWEEYIRETRCGSTGTFSGGGYVYVSNGDTPSHSNPLEWYVASCTVVDVTDVDDRVSILTGRINEAEQKITAEAITNTVKQNFYTKQETENAITSKGYATTSQVQQTAENVQFKFSQSGGYNLIRNGNPKPYHTEQWWIENARDGGGYWYPHSGDLGLANSGSGATMAWTNSFKVNPWKKHSFSCWIQRERNVKSCRIYFIGSASDNGAYDFIQQLYYDYSSTDWVKVEQTFEMPGNINYGRIRIDNEGTYDPNANFVVFFNEVQLLLGDNNYPQWSPNPAEIYDGITTIDKDGIDVATSYGAHTQFHSGGMSSYNNSNQRTLGIENGGISFHSWNNNALSAYITQSSLWGGSQSANGLAISTTANGTYVALGTSSLSDVNTTLNMDQALTISASDGFQPRGINFWKDVHAHGYGIRQLSHLQLAGSGAIQFDYLNNSPSTIFEAVDNGHSLYVMGGYQLHLGCMEGSGSPHGVIWMRGKTDTHSYTHWDFHNYTMYNMKTASTYANHDTRRIGESYGVTSNVDGVRYLYKNVELVNGKAIRSIPLEYKGCEYDIVSIVCKGKGSAWVETEDENKFEINGDCQSVTIEIMIYPSEEVMATSMRALEEAPILELPKEIKGEVAPFLTNEAIKEENE